jgi:hypothetical protein
LQLCNATKEIADNVWIAMSWGRCYDFKIFSLKKFAKNRRFLNFEKVDHNIGIQEKRQFFRRILGKIA